MADAYRHPEPRWPEWMRRETAAAFLEIGTTTFDKLVDEGRVHQPLIVPGTRLVRWSRTKLIADVQAWEEARANSEVALVDL